MKSKQVAVRATELHSSEPRRIQLDTSLLYRSKAIRGAADEQTGPRSFRHQPYRSVSGLSFVWE